MGALINLRATATSTEGGRKEEIAYFGGARDHLEWAVAGAVLCWPAETLRALDAVGAGDADFDDTDVRALIEGAKAEMEASGGMAGMDAIVHSAAWRRGHPDCGVAEIEKYLDAAPVIAGHVGWLVGVLKKETVRRRLTEELSGALSDLAGGEDLWTSCGRVADALRAAWASKTAIEKALKPNQPKEKTS